MRLEQVLRDSCIATGQEFADKKAVIEAIATRVGAELGEGQAFCQQVAAALEQRERICSTGIGHGVALPHCHLPEMTDFVVGAFAIPAGVDFNAVDDQPVDLVFFIIGPETAKSEHIHLMAVLAQACDEGEDLARLRAQSDQHTFRKTLVEICRDEMAEAAERQSDMIHVFVQNDEDSFYEILEMIAAVAATSAVVIDSEETARYLTKTPLFAGLFAEERVDTSRMIVAVVDRRMTAEIICRIQKVTGPLPLCKHVLVTVTQLFYAAGGLEV